MNHPFTSQAIADQRIKGLMDDAGRHRVATQARAAHRPAARARAGWARHALASSLILATRFSWRRRRELRGDYSCQPW
jgi:hypothetical protein